MSISNKFSSLTSTISFMRPELQFGSVMDPIPLNPPVDFFCMYSHLILMPVLTFCSVNYTRCWGTHARLFSSCRIQKLNFNSEQLVSLNYIFSCFRHLFKLYLMFRRWLGEKYDGIRACWNPRLKRLYLYMAISYDVLLYTRLLYYFDEFSFSRNAVNLQFPSSLQGSLGKIYLDGELWYFF